MAEIRISRLLRLLAIANLLGSATSSYATFSGYAEAFRGGVGPYDANSTEFEAVVAASNATGVFKIPGYDVSKPFPGEPIDGWTMNVAAVDLSRATRRSWNTGEDGIQRLVFSDAMVGHSMTIQAPESLIKTNDDGTKVVNTHPSWGMCMWNYGSPNQLQKERWNNPDNKPLAEDGSCKGFLSDACIAALEKGAGSSYKVADPADEDKYKGRYGFLTTCGSFLRPDECGDHGPGGAGSSVPSYAGVPIPYLNGSITNVDGWEFEMDQRERYNSSKDLHEFWDSMVVNYWVTVTIMVNATADPEKAGYERGPGLPRVHCIAPNGMGTGKGFTFSGTVPANTQNFKGGDGGEGGGDDDSGAGMMTPAKGAMWAALLALPLALGWVC
jgi:hypothetical protein